MIPSRYKELLRNLVGRDLKLRYRNTALGFVWSLLQPALMFLVYFAVFSLLADRFGLRAYPLFLLVGLFAFTFLTSAVSKATPSVVQAAALMRQVAFPRVVLPLSTVLAEGVQFTVMVGILVLAGAWDWAGSGGGAERLLPLVALPVVFAAHFAFTLGLGLVFSTLDVFYRDTEQLVNTLMTVWFFATPVFYPPPTVDKFMGLPGASAETAPWLYRIYYLNPMAHVVKGYRDILYDHRWPEVLPLSVAIGAGLVTLLLGLYVFQRNQARFAEEA